MNNVFYYYCLLLLQIKVLSIKFKKILKLLHPITLYPF